MKISERVTVNGDVHLILCNSVSLKIPEGIIVTEGNSLTIYGQIHNEGKLIIQDAKVNHAGIGGGLYETCGTVTINGGDITVASSKRGAVCGNGADYAVAVFGGSFTVSGGAISAGAGGSCAVYSDVSPTLSGAPVIEGGVFLDNSDPEGGDLYIAIDEALTYAEPVAVDMYNPGVFTRGWSAHMGDADPSGWFAGAGGNWRLRLDSGEAELYEPQLYIVGDMFEHGALAFRFPGTGARSPRAIPSPSPSSRTGATPRRKAE